MDENQNTSPPILSNAHPPLLLFAVLFINDGDSQWIQKDFGSPIKADPVFSQVRLGFGRIPFKSIAQPSPTTRNESDRRAKADLPRHATAIRITTSWIKRRVSQPDVRSTRECG